MWRWVSALGGFGLSRSASRLAIGLAWIFVVSCNVFNPSGTGEYPDDPDAYVDLGQRALQGRRFQEAWTDFSQAISLDSSKSLAYQGLAKAEMGRWGFSISQLVEIADSISAPGADKLEVLLRQDSIWFSRIYPPMMRVAAIYSRLRTLDSSGRSDGVFPSRLIENELSTIQNNQSYFLVIDFNRDTLIQRSELEGVKLMDLASGGLGVDPDKLKSKIDPVTGAIDAGTKSSINGILQNVNSINQDSALRSKLLGSSGGGDEVTGGIDENAKAFFRQLGSSTSFYLVNDSLDNDGDGCVNEEVNGDDIDNDGDSLVDEDSRIGLAPAEAPHASGLALKVPPDGFLHDRLALVQGGWQVVPGDDESNALRWHDETGLLEPYAGMRWVRWDDEASGNDTIYQRVLKENGFDGPGNERLVRNSPDYGSIRTLAIVEVRKKVLAATGAARAELGRRTVGGCWDYAK